MDNKRLVTLILKYIFSFFVAISLFVLVLCMEFGFGFLNEQTVRKGLIGSGYVRNITNDLTEIVENEIKESALPKTLSSELVDYEKMYITVNNAIEKGFDGKGVGDTVDDVAAFKEEFRNKVFNYLEEQNVEVDSELEKSVETLSEKVASIYRKYAKSKMTSKYYNYVRKVEKTIIITIIICAVAFVLSVVMIYSLNSYRHRAVRGISFGVLTALFCNIAAQIFMYISFNSMNKMNFHEYYADFLTEYVGKSMTIWYTINVALLLCFVGLLIRIRKLKES